ncbi:unnamed protein product [Thelazia callipaeda]|uniref:Uncharacterized protein n=1 Tax=Thelazia callipaeda TaxID=103827 RepID=A0A0N5CS85_THECL|nr:unnamed protein product [Thelazia callipaeda]
MLFENFSSAESFEIANDLNESSLHQASITSYLTSTSTTILSDENSAHNSNRLQTTQIANSYGMLCVSI